jgi:Saxitoxin biosynthesis operon protein SxtJ
MAAFFLLLAFRFRSRAGSLWVSLISIALTLIVIALTRPAVLAPFNRAWMALGKLLNRVVSPVVLALLFFGVVWPIGFLMRLTGNDALRLKRAAATGSYWVAREPLASDHFTRQF